MSKPAFVLIASAALAGCSSVIDFGPEPGSAGDESYLHYQPELHGPEAKARAQEQEDAAATSSAPAEEPAAAQEKVELPPPPATPVAPAAPTSEAMFNDAIRRAVAAGELDRALRLLEEAERLGSRSARPTFIEALNSRD